VHPFRFLRKPLIHATTPSQALLDGLSTAQGALKVSFALALICQLMAVTASEERAPIQDRHLPAASACWAKQPRTVAAIMARHVLYPDRIFRLLPFTHTPAAMPVRKDHCGIGGATVNRTCIFSVPFPKEGEATAGVEIAFLLQKADVYFLVAVGSVFPNAVSGHAFLSHPKSLAKPNVQLI
jgi:hypothetical protein